MGVDAASAATRPDAAQDKLVARFARLMAERYGARVYLFGSRARGVHRPDSDYDVVAVSQRFAGERQRYRARDRYKLWYEAGGWGIGLDLHCYTEEEFYEEIRGLGYLGQAKRHGELIRVRTGGVIARRD